MQAYFLSAKANLLWFKVLYSATENTDFLALLRRSFRVKGKEILIFFSESINQILAKDFKNTIEKDKNTYRKPKYENFFFFICLLIYKNEKKNEENSFYEVTNRQ